MDNETGYGGLAQGAAAYDEAAFRLQYGAQASATNSKDQSLQAHQRRRALATVLNATERGLTLDELQAALDLVRTHIGE